MKISAGSAGHIGAHMAENSGGVVENVERIREDVSWESTSVSMTSLMKMKKKRGKKLLKTIS
jgi:hypothetical protein